MRLILSLILVITCVVIALVFTTSAIEINPGEEPVIDDPVKSVAGRHDAVAADLEPAPTSQREKVQGTAQDQQPVSNALPARTVRVRVLRRSDETPIEGAEIGYLKEAIKGAGPQERTVVLLSGAEGWTEVPLYSYGQHLEITAGDLFTAVTIHHDREEPLTIYLERDRNLRLRVLSVDGEPAPGVMIKFMTQKGSEPGLNQDFGPTDALGVFEMTHVQDLVKAKGQCVVKAYAKGLSVKSDPVGFDILDPSVEVIDLRLPHCGRIELHMIMASGLELSPKMLEDVTAFAFTMDESERPNYTQVDLDDKGRGVIASVGFGLKVTMSARGLIDDMTAVDGPTREEPVRKITLRVPDSLIFLTGRVVDPEGKIITDTLVSVSWTKTGESPSNSAFSLLKGDGVFLIACPGLDSSSLQTVELQSYSENVPLKADISAQVIGRSGIVNIGDVKLTSLPTLVTGRIIVPKSLSHLKRVGILCESKTDEGEWALLTDYSLDWGEDLNFTIRGPAGEGASFRLRFPPGEHQAREPLPFELGAQGVEIELTAGLTAHASFLVDDDTEVKDLHVLLQLDGEELEEIDPHITFSDQWRTHLVRKGLISSAWKGLAPGQYHLVVMCVDSACEIVRIDGITLKDGEKLNPSLKEIDLRERIDSIHYEIRDAATNAPIKGTVHFMAKGVGSPRWSWNFNRGWTNDLKIAGPLDVIVAANGYRLIEFQGIDADLAARLEKSSPCKLKVVLPESCAEDVICRVSLEPQPVTRWAQDRIAYRGINIPLIGLLEVEGPCGAEGEVTLYPHLDGPHKLSVTLHRGDKHEALTDFEPKIIDPAAGVTKIVVRSVPAAMRSKR